jgi:methyltransferase
MASLGRLWNVRIVERREQPVVTAGPYAWVRHPNYLAVVLEVAAVPVLLGALGTALLGSLANAVVLYFRIRAEEAYLFAQPGYAAAFAGKKRFLPGLF